MFVRRVHRSGLPLVRRHAGEHPARNIPNRTLWNGVVDFGRGPAVRKRRGADGIFRIGPQRYNSLLESITARGTAGPGPGDSGGASKLCWLARL